MSAAPSSAIRRLRMSPQLSHSRRSDGCLACKHRRTHQSGTRTGRRPTRPSTRRCCHTVEVSIRRTGARLGGNYPRTPLRPRKRTDRAGAQVPTCPSGYTSQGCCSTRTALCLVRSRPHNCRSSTGSGKSCRSPMCHSDRKSGLSGYSHRHTASSPACIPPCTRPCCRIRLGRDLPLVPTHRCRCKSRASRWLRSACCQGCTCPCTHHPGSRKRRFP
jgi:hypothetical protein